MKTGLILLFAIALSVVGQQRQPDGAAAAELAKAHELTAELIKLYAAKKYKEALPLARTVLEIRQRLLSPDDDSLGRAYTNLGEIYFELDKDKEAEESLTRALDIYQSHPGRNGMAISKTLDRLGYLRFRKRDYSGADSLYVRSLELMESELGRTNPETIKAMKNFACLNLFAASNQRSPSNQRIPENTSDPNYKLRARASCWLHSSDKDCANTDFTGLAQQEILNGKALRLVQPSYPIEASRQGHSGYVYIGIVINEQGKVTGANPLCGGYPELNQAGVEAARASKFTPTILNGQAVKVTGTIIYRFANTR
jgi:TonB family protein